MRKGSPTYGRWISIELSGDDSLMLYVPPAFAHGFIVLSSLADVTNKTISKDTYFYTLPSIPSHQGRGNLLPLPWWERARVRECGFTYELLSMYKCTEEYNPENDRGIIWNDPDLRIKWPVKKPILSEKDRTHPLLKDADNDFMY
jgi:dTDP-4-dehydrorhamnose 3,5-epimerase